MALIKIDKLFDQNKKEVRYLNKDFSGFVNNLIEFSKVYFPDSYKDFNESSPGMMFIEQAAYVGDVLSLYMDSQLKESLMSYATERKNVLSLSQFLGYRPKNITPAVTVIDVFQLLPSTGVGSSNAPDYTFALRIKEGMQVSSTTDPAIQFRTNDFVDFTDRDNTEITVFERDSGTQEPTFYLLKKQVQAAAGTIKSIDVDFTDPVKFASTIINDENVTDILEVRDSNNNRWYEVPYLAQDTVFIEVANNTANDPDLVQFASSVPYMIKLLRTPKRFISKILTDGTTQLEFGAGVTSGDDELLVPNPSNLNVINPDVAIDPANFLQTKTYGQAPANTTLTVTYVVGGGLASSVSQGDLTTISLIEFENDEESFNVAQRALLATLKNGVAVNNDIPATGGRGPETVEEIRRNALAFFGAQNRAVTARDYQVRALSMPAKFGSVTKVHASQDLSLDVNSPGEQNDIIVAEKNNPLAINLYVLGYDTNKNLTTLNTAVKKNLKTYMNEFRMLTDGINILNGFIINIQIEFEIIVYSNFNKNEILITAIDAVKAFFNIDNLQFNQPINLSDLELTLANVEGVRSVSKVTIKNKCGGQYAGNSYNIDEATRDNIVYPSLDPSMWEVKFPDTDIKGKAR